MNHDVEVTRLIEAIRALHVGEEDLPSSLALQVVEQAVAQLGLEGVVRAYLSSNFGVDHLAEVDEAHIGQALKFLLELQRLAPRPSIGLPGGATIDGDIIVIRGCIKTPPTAN